MIASAGEDTAPTRKEHPCPLLGLPDSDTGLRNDKKVTGQVSLEECRQMATNKGQNFPAKRKSAMSSKERFSSSLNFIPDATEEDCSHCTA